MSQKKNIVGVSLCTLVSAGFFWLYLYMSIRYLYLYLYLWYLYLLVFATTLMCLC